jgi:HEAT repeat protein
MEQGKKEQKNTGGNKKILLTLAVAGLIASAVAVYFYFSSYRDQTAGNTGSGGQSAAQMIDKITSLLGGSPPPFVLKDGVLPAMPNTIKGSAPIRIASVRLTSTTQNSYFEGDSRVYTLRMVVENTGRTPLIWGDRCVLYESVSDGTAFEGMTQSRAGALGMLPKYFGVSNDQENDQDNDLHRRTHTFGTQMTVTFRETEKPVNPSFGVIAPGTRAVLHLNFQLRTMLKEKLLHSVRFISPALYAPDAPEGPAVIISAEFTRPDSDLNEKADWLSTGQTQIPLDFAHLAKLVGGQATPAMLRLVAANWLAEIYRDKSVPILLNRLPPSNESQGEIRSAAVQTLGYLKAHAAVGDLVKLIADHDEPPGIRGTAAKALGKVGDAGNLETLLAQVHDTNEYPAKSAIEAIGTIGGTNALRMLSGLLAEKDFPHARFLPAALARCGRESINILREATDNNKQEVVVAAIQELGKFLAAKPNGHPEALTEDPPFPFPSDPIGEQQARHDAEQLRHGQPGVPPEQAHLIFATLKKALADDRSTIREAVIEALRTAPGQEAGQLLLNLAKQSSAISPKLIAALASRYEPEAEPIVTALLTKQTPNDIRLAAMEAVSTLKIANTAEEAMLLNMAADREDELRWRSLKLLCTCNSEAAKTAVHKALDETGKEEEYSRQELRKTCDSAAAPGHDPNFALRLARAEAEARSAAADEIAKKQVTAALPALKIAVKNETQAGTLARMVTALKALGCHDQDQLPVFLAKLDARDPGVVTEAAGMLRYLTGVGNGPFPGGSDAEFAEDISYWKKIVHR